MYPCARVAFAVIGVNVESGDQSMRTKLLQNGLEVPDECSKTLHEPSVEGAISEDMDSKEVVARERDGKVDGQ